MRRYSLLDSMPHPAILFFAAAVGFISLSQEILWMRVIGFATAGAPEVFGNVLGFFLVGIALGALLGRRVCEIEGARLMLFIGGVLLVAAVLYFFSVPLIALFRERNFEWGPPVLPRGLLMAYTLVAFIAFLQGGIFTVLCHVGVREDSAVGASVSWIYAANIAGSVAGPLLTGFVLLDLWTLEQNLLAVSIATAVVGGLALSRARIGSRGRVLGWVAVAVCIAVFAALQPQLEHRLLEKLQGWRFDSHKITLQNRSGIIGVDASSSGPDAVYGGGAYDGRMNVDPSNDSNGIHRAYFVAALHPSPREVLDIGLSTGSWARVLADYEAVERLTVIEINQGYLDLVSHYPLQAAVLNDPDVDIIVDDGRRWLNRNPQRKFDVILMNTTWHWRGYASNLLSRDFLELLRSRLKPGGIVYYNGTRSEGVPYTAAQVFKHVVRYANFVAASDVPIGVDAPARRRNLERFVRDGRLVFAGDKAAAVAQRIVDYELDDIGDRLRAEPRPDLLITDDNMAVEYKFAGNRRVGLAAWNEGDDGPTMYDPKRNWAATLARLWAHEP